MPTKLVRTGRVKGYRPTRDQFEELLELAQRGVEADSIAYLSYSQGYSQGTRETYPNGQLNKISPGNLSEIIKEAKNPVELNNLDFAISSKSPVRKVTIQIGAGDWTTYGVESDDQTWAYGRYHELTEKLLADRSFYAKGNAPSPQIPQEGSDDKWRDAAWEIKTNWRMSLVGHLIGALWILLAAELVFIGYFIAQYYAPGGNTTQQIRNSKRTAADILHPIGHNIGILLGFNVSYIIAAIALGRWLKSFRKSRVMLQKISLASQFSFRQDRTDSVSLASFYAAFLTLIVTIIAVIIR